MGRKTAVFEWTGHKSKTDFIKESASDNSLIPSNEFPWQQSPLDIQLFQQNSPK